MIIFAADDPLVLAGTYDVEGYTPKERRAQQRQAHRTERRVTTMRFFDDDQVGCYLDHIDHRVEKTKDGKEIKMVDLTLRVQPFTPELAVALDPDVRALLFSLGDATPKPKLKAAHFALTVPKQQLTIAMVPELEGSIVLADCDVSDVRARTEKGVDGFGLVFYVSYGPASPRDLEYVCDWLTQQRFVTFVPQQPALDFVGADAPVEEAPPRRGRGRPRKPPVEAGDELRPGISAEH